MKKRTIKFRAWSKNEKDMLLDVHQLTRFKDLLTSTNWEIMQFTGLLDSKGKEIYEGDIVKDVYSYSPEMSSLAWDDERIIEVKIPNIYLDYAEYPELSDFKEMKKYFEDSNGKYGVEVIGNIYENPELLTKN